MTDQADDGIGQQGRRTVTVSFSFDAGWRIVRPDRTLNGFPPGGGLTELNLVIDPVDLSTLDPTERAAAIAKRIADLATVTQALALASVQFSDAVSGRVSD